MKKVRFSNKVKVKGLGVSLNEHVREIKNPPMIIQKPTGKSVKKENNSNYFLYFIFIFIIFAIIFLIYKIYKKNKKEKSE